MIDDLVEGLDAMTPLRRWETLLYLDIDVEPPIELASYVSTFFGGMTWAQLRDRVRSMVPILAQEEASRFLAHLRDEKLI